MTGKYIFNNKELGSDVEGALKVTGGKWTEYSGSFSYDGSKKIESNAVRLATEEEVLGDIAVTSFLFSKSDVSSAEYIHYFTGKNTNDIDYQEMINKFKLFVKVGIYIEATEEERKIKQKEMRKHYNPETLVIVLTTAEALVKK